MIIQADHHPYWYKMLNLYAGLRIRLHFREMIIHGDIPHVPERSILLMGNHHSWWDGFIAQYLNQRLWIKRFFVMMLEEELKKRSFLRRAGAFSIKPSSKSLLESLDYASKVLSDPANLLLLFPQGKIQSIHQRPLSFAKGWTRIIEQSSHTPLIVFWVSLPDYAGFPQPSMNNFLLAYDPDQEGNSASEIENAFNRHLFQSIKALET